MTTAMSDAAARAKRALRVGLVRGERIVDERVFRGTEDVTLGTSESNTFVLAGPKLPKSFKLLTVEDGRYMLRFTGDMDGRLSTPAGVMGLDDLKRDAAYEDGVYQLALDSDARGKVEVGQTAILFQFVSALPPGVKPKLPPSVMRGAVGIDWNTTVIAAFSFLLHFMAIGSVYSDWMDPVVDTEVNVAALVEMVKNLPPPPEVEQKNVEEEEEADKSKEEEQPKPKKVNPQKAPTREKKRLTATEVAALSDELDSLDLSTLGALTGKSATADVLSSIDSIDSSVMDQAAASGAGVSSGGPGGLELSAAGGAIRPGEAGGSLASLGDTKKSTPDTSGTVKKVEGPKGSAKLGGTSVAGGQVSNASRVVARMRAGFRACYTRALAANPDASGRISLALRIGPGGEVTQVTASSSGNLPASVVNCVRSRAKAGRFAPPQGGSAVVSVPVNFIKQ
jgi:hypothetical protein